MVSDHATTEEHEQAPGSSMFETLWRRKGLLILGIFVGLALGLLYYSQAAPVYRSGAQILVIKRQPAPIQTGVGGGYHREYEDYIATQMTIVKSIRVAGRAAENPKLKSLQTFAGKDDLTSALLNGLMVDRDGSLLKIFFEGPIAADCPIVVSAMIDAYREYLSDTYRVTSDETLKLITEARDVLDQSLTKRTQEYQDFRLNASTDLFLKGKEGATLQEETMSRIQDERSTLMIRKADLEAKLSALERAVKNGVSRAVILEKIARSDEEQRQAGLKSFAAQLEQRLFPLLLEEETLMEKLGPDHPRVKDVRRRIERTEEHVERLSQLTKQADEEQEAKEETSERHDPIQLHIEVLKEQLHDVAELDASLGNLFREQQRIAKQVTEFELRDQDHRRHIQLTEQLYSSIVKRLEETTLFKDTGGYEAQVITQAGLGGKLSPNALATFFAAGLLGAIGGAALGFLAESLDKSFRSPAEIQRRLALPVVGHIPHLKPSAVPADAGGHQKAFDPILCTHFRPRSLDAEAYRGVRTALYFSTRGSGHKVIQITSPNLGDGKSTLAANLAVSIAQSGKRVLLVDGDLRKPRIHKLFNLKSERGLACVIQGQAEIKDAVVEETGIPNLTILPTGPRPTTPAELLTSPRFQEVLGTVKEQYDVVLVDTPPLLVVTDPSVIAPRVDGVLITMRITRHSRPQAQQAHEMLMALGATVLGVVVNAIGPNARRYGGQNYGYTYRYQFGYEGDRYGYYGEDEEAETNGHAAAEANGSNGERDSQMKAEVPHAVEQSGKSAKSKKLFRWF